VKRVAIVGLGLIGGSFGLAVRRRSPDIEVVGVTRSGATAEAAVAREAVERASTSLADIAGSDLVVLACPLGVQRQVLEDCVPHLAEGTRVTDVGSVKGEVVRHAHRVLDPGRNPFLGGHPMAGREVGGVENAEASLFEDRVWVFTPMPAGWTSDPAVSITNERAGVRGGYWPDAFGDLVDLVRNLGARPLSLSPETHDRYVALVSHLPFLMSSAILDAAAASQSWEQAQWLASSGFRDVTRLAGGDPDMYTAIVAQNRDAVLDGIASLHGALERIEAAISRDEPGFLRDLLAEALETRRQWLETAAPRDT